MSRTIKFNSERFGHFHRKGRIEVHGNHQQMKKHLVVLSFIEGKSVSGDSAMHIYLSEQRARELAKSLINAADETKRGGAP